jgi:hypothetical protein
VQYAAYHFQIIDVRAIVPEGQELLMIGRWLAQRLPSLARHEVMHGPGPGDVTDGPCYVIAIGAQDAPKNVRESIDEKFKKMKGYRGMKVIELGKSPGYDLVRGRIPKP